MDVALVRANYLANPGGSMPQTELLFSQFPTSIFVASRVYEKGLAVGKAPMLLCNIYLHVGNDLFRRPIIRMTEALDPAAEHDLRIAKPVP
jgi:hypothetical protein